MNFRIGDILSLFDEPDGWLIVLILGALLPVPGANLFVFGYLGKLCRESLLSGEFSLPELDDFGPLFVSGWHFFLLVLSFFSPCLIFLMAGFLFFVSILKGSGMAYMGHFFYALFFLSLGILFFLLSFLLIPVAFFRYAESGEIGWSLEPGGMFEDMGDMGRDYWEILLVLGLSFAVAELLPVGISMVLSLFAAGRIIAVFFLLFSSSFIVSYLAVLGVKLSVPVFRDLRYHYPAR